jgi:branched-chain amino acid transport system substrate-binding protein
MSRIKLLAMMGLVLVVVVVPLLGACAGSKPAPAAEKSVKVGYIAFSTGPVGDCGLPATQAGNEYVRWVNEHGGIDGVKLDFMWIDSGYEVPRSIAAYQRLKQWGAQVIWSYGSTPNDAIRALATEDGMPIVAWGGPAELFFPAQKNVFFATYESYDREGRAGLLWLMKNIKTLPAKPKVGMIHPDDAYGWSFANGPRYYFAQDGYELVPDELAPHGALDVSTQIRHFIDAKVDIISLTYTVGTAAVVMRDARRLGFKGILMGTHYSMIDYNIGRLSENGAEGAYFNTHTYLLTDKRPGMEEIYDMVKAYHPDADVYKPHPDIVCWMHGPIAVKTTVEGIRAAIKQVGYDKLSRKAIWNGLESLKNTNLFGLMNLSFAPDDHTGSQGFGMLQYQNGDYKLIGDFVPAPPITDTEKAGQFPWTK